MPDDFSGARQFHREAEAPPPLVPVAARLPDPRAIPPREWMVEDMLCRKFVSVLVATGGTGKTALGLALSMAGITGRPLTGHHVHKQAPVWFFNLEDPAEEMDRRTAAAMLHHDVRPKDIEGRLFLHSGRDRAVCIARPLDGRGTITFPDRDAITEGVKTCRIGTVIVDPFIASHSLGENDNSTINEAIKAWGTVADKGNCAVLLVHHARKGGDTPGDAGMSRGASALVDGSRITRTLIAMSENEAKSENIPLHERRFHIRLDDGKINITAGNGRPRWFKLVGVNLGNGTPDYPRGDNVQTVEPWQPSGAFGDLTDAELNAVLDLIEKGLPSGSRYAAKINSKDKERWVVPLLVTHLRRTEEQAKTILSDWMRTGLLTERPYDDPAQRKERMGLFVDDAKRPGPR